jgi:ketosteroid isomerase-like protein
VNKHLLAAMAAPLIMLSAPILAHAQAATATTPAGLASPEAAALEKLNAEWLTAYKTRDGAALDRILADDFEAIYPGGRVMRKADLVKIATNPARTVSDIAWDDLKIMVFGDVAVVRARSRTSGKTAEGDFTTSNDYADVYVKRAGAWRAISAHVVRVTE